MTHAHRESGPDGSMSAVESLLNVPVDFYVRANMTAVVDIVDALDGVEFDVPFDMEVSSQTDRGPDVVVEEGEQTLSGAEALAVVRSRDIDSDLGRGQRQLELVQAILSKAKSTGALSKLDELIEVVADNTKHNMESKTIRSLAAYYSFNDINFNTTQIKGSDFWFQQNGAYFYWANEEHLYRISETLREVLGLEAPDPYDLINIRLSDVIVPYRFIEGTELEDYQPAEPPYFMRDGYDSQIGNGFNMEEGQDEESVEEPDRDMNPEFTDEEPTTEQPSVENGTMPQYEESTQEPYYEEETQEPYQEDAAPYYEEETQEPYYKENTQEPYQAPYYEENTQETPSYDGV
ncbi:LCP family protein [Salinicoccus sp. CNSTN-B1]